MGKKKDQFKGQLTLPGFDGTYKQAVNNVYKEYKKVDQALQDIIQVGPDRPAIENEFELCQELAIALKQELRESGMSRDQFCDGVNEFLGRTEKDYAQNPPLCRKPLTKTSVDKMISDPTNYLIHAYHLFAFQHVLKGFGITNTIIAAKGGRVMSEEDQKLFTRAKIGELKTQLMQFEKELR
ncbi:MAG: hypothetical protein GY710_12000 [Desulfobacteraceae bacterium]|nr:hypothetical protein [Desulfobacteraceae bacterium]